MITNKCLCFNYNYEFLKNHKNYHAQKFNDFALCKVWWPLKDPFVMELERTIIIKLYYHSFKYFVFVLSSSMTNGSFRVTKLYKERSHFIFVHDNFYDFLKIRNCN